VVPTIPVNSSRFVYRNHKTASWVTPSSGFDWAAADMPGRSLIISLQIVQQANLPFQIIESLATHGLLASMNRMRQSALRSEARMVGVRRKVRFLIPILSQRWLLSVQLRCFFSSQMGSHADADDMLQGAWLRIHRMRHTYRPGQPLLPWVYAIARRVRVDNYRARRRIGRREVAAGVELEASAGESPSGRLPSFAELVAPLPESQREVLTMLKVGGLSIEEVAKATSSSVGAVKQKVHRAYDRLRELLQEAIPGRTRTGEKS
jgi:RNA polymerase sigma-70 factor, ECF subfamily